MRRINRREFAKVAGAAMVGPVVAGAMVATRDIAKGGDTQAQQAANAPAAKPKLTSEQEEKVKQALERRERQLTGLRGRTLKYDAEPAFVFRVKTRSRSREVTRSGSKEVRK